MATTGKKTIAVGEASAVGDIGVMGVIVGMGVGDGVSVAGVTMAVWVWKKYAANVPTPAVRLALMSGVSAGTCPAQEAANSATRINTNRERFETFIFTSIGVWCWISLPINSN